MKRSSRFRMVVGLVLLMLLLSLASISSAGPGGKSGETNGSTANANRMHPMVKEMGEKSGNEFVQVIVSLDLNANEHAIAAKTGGQMVKSWPSIHSIYLRVPTQALAGLSNMPGVKYISPDSPMGVTDYYDQNKVKPNAQAAMNTQPFWHSFYVGTGVGVAVIDSGVAAHPDLADHTVNVVLPSVGDWQDGYGHGTHVAGIIAGNNGDVIHIGVAPEATVYNLKVTDNQGSARESDLLDALQWVLLNHVQKNIRVVNISMQSSVANSYLTSPLDGMIEKLWFDGVVVVVSAGNNGTATCAECFPPANDPYVITVGALDDYATKGRGDDTIVSWSSSGNTQDGFVKPDILAAGRRVVSTLAPGSVLAQNFAAQIVDTNYITLSGTSMAAPVVSGSVANMLQFNPSLTPNQVKSALINFHRGLLDKQPAGGTPTPDMGKVLAAIKDVSKLPPVNQGLTPSTYADPTFDPTDDSNVYWRNVYWRNDYSVTNIYYDN